MSHNQRYISHVFQSDIYMPPHTPPTDYSLSLSSKLTLLIFKTCTVINSFMSTEKSVEAMKLLSVEIDWVITLFWETQEGK